MFDKSDVAFLAILVTGIVLFFGGLATIIQIDQNNEREFGKECVRSGYTFIEGNCVKPEK